MKKMSKSDNDKSDPYINIAGFVFGGISTIALPIAGLMFGMVTGFSLANQAVIGGICFIFFLCWKWPAWSGSTKQFAAMFALGVLVGCGFIAVAYYNMREMNGGWFE